MSWKTTAVLLVLVLGLGGFFYYDTYWLTPTRDKAESVKGRLWTVEPKDVEALTIKRQAETIRLKRAEGGGWEMLEPVKARGDRGPVDDVVTSLATVRVDREVDPRSARLADFGLDPPAAEIRLEVKGRAEPLVLLVGGKSPTGAWVYGKEASKPAVITLSEVVSRDTSRPAADFRDKTVIAFDRKSVTGADLEVDGARVSLLSDEPGKWRIVRPHAYRADADLIADFLDKLESAKVREFVAEAPTSLHVYGLDRPASVTLWLGRDKERSSKALRFGRLDTDKKGVYVMRAGEAGVMLAGEELWTVFPKTVAVLRDKVALAYAADRVARVELDSARGRVVLEKDGSAWKLTAPEPLKADSGAVSSLLWRIRDLRAVGFLAEAPSDVPRYLGKPEVTVRVWEEGAKEPKTLLLKSSPEQRGGKPAAVAAVEGQGPVMLVDGKALQDFSLTAMDLRDKAVFPAFETTDVKRAAVTASGKRLVVERTGDSDWKVLEPSRGPAKAVQVSNLLLTLRTLRWKEIAAPDGGDLSRFGLDRPGVEVSLQKAGGTEVGALQVGHQEGSLSYVRLKAGGPIYRVESKLLEDLKKAPAEIPG